MSSDDFVKNILLTSMPASDRNQIDQELKRSFIFGKYRTSIPKKQTKQKKTLNHRQKKALGLYDIPKESVKYEDMQMIHNIWKEYMSQYLNITLNSTIPTIEDKTWESFSLLLVKADYHGALMTIIRSRCPSLVGKQGICIMDTKNTFKIVSTDNITRVIPKENSVFKIHLDQIEFTVFGKNLMIRPAERSVKKIKQHMEADI